MFSWHTVIDDESGLVVYSHTALAANYPAVIIKEIEQLAFTVEGNRKSFFCGESTYGYGATGCC